MKGQSLVLQFLLFFIIGLALFISISGFFRIQSDIFRQDVAEFNRKLTGSYLSSLAISMASCKECDIITSTVKLRNTTASYIFELSLSEKGLKVSSEPDGQKYLAGMHNLNYSLGLTGTSASSYPITLTLDKEKNNLAISHP